MANEDKWKIAFFCVMAIILFAIGFLLGRITFHEPTEKIVTKYVKGDVIHDSIKCPIPYMVVVPVDTIGIIQQCVRDGIYTELFPTKIITKYIEVTREDTSTVMKDWASKRYYSEILFNIDTLGSCVINTEVQYNRMRLISYDYKPIIKTITKTEYVKKLFSPFVGLGVSINPWDSELDQMANVNLGFFLKEAYGMQIKYQRGFNSRKDFLGLDVMYKF